LNNFTFIYTIAGHLKVLIPVDTELIIVADAKYAHPLMAYIHTKFHENWLLASKFENGNKETYTACIMIS
jgi:hypothetical protein